MSRHAIKRATLLILALAVSLAAWLEGHAAGCKDQAPTTWDIEIAPASEPGERLVVTGRVISLADLSPLQGITVYIYHADAKGNYALPGHENEPQRLCGVLRTNKRGEYRLRTSMPGGYEGYAPHIHFEIWGPRVDRQYTFVNLGPITTRLDTTSTWTLLKWVVRSPVATPPSTRRSNATGIDRRVRRGADGVLRCTRDLAVGVR